MANDAIAVVKAFCAAWDAGDTEAIMGTLAPGCFFHNIPTDPLIGHEQIRPVIAGFLAMATSIRFEVTGLAQTPEGTVLMERIDHFVINGKSLTLPVMGAFEVEGGKIAKWRDYFDQSMLDALLEEAGVTGVI